MDLRNTVAVVTGGASGLGLATVRELSDRGARVVLVDLPSSSGELVAKWLGESVVFAPADVTSESEVAEALDVAEGLGALRVVVNCAEIGRTTETLSEQGVFPLADFTEVINVNLVGTFNVIRLAAERIARTAPVREERGVIVNTASVAAFDGQVGQAAYAAAKSGIVGLTLPVARDLAARKIRVVTIAPGLLHAIDSVPDETNDSFAPPPRPDYSDECAALVRHIVENPMLNGETIRLDGAALVAPH